MSKVNQQKAIEICKMIYDVLQPHGYFPALTGGCLYKDGSRKDIDIVIYRHRQERNNVDMNHVGALLASSGIEIVKSFGFVTKAKMGDVGIDFFNPESEDGNYDSEEGNENPF